MLILFKDYQVNKAPKIKDFLFYVIFKLNSTYQHKLWENEKKEKIYKVDISSFKNFQNTLKSQKYLIKNCILMVHIMLRTSNSIVDAS